MDDDNIFDKDDALDYVMYEELNKKKQDGSGNGGCFGIIVILILPIVGVGVLSINSLNGTLIW